MKNSKLTLSEKLAISELPIVSESFDQIKSLENELKACYEKAAINKTAEKNYFQKINNSLILESKISKLNTEIFLKQERYEKLKARKIREFTNLKYLLNVEAV